MAKRSMEHEASEGRRQPEQGERFATGVEQIMGGARPRDWGFDFQIAQC